VNIVVDTHALLWFLTKDKKLSKLAKSSINNSKKVFIPTIVLLELLYTMHKINIEDKFPLVLKLIKKHKKYAVISLDIAIVEKVAQLTNLLEMHDKVIVATADMLKLPLVSKDSTIQKVYKNIIW